MKEECLHSLVLGHVLAPQNTTCPASLHLEARQIPQPRGQQQKQPFAHTCKPCMVRSGEQELVQRRGSNVERCTGVVNLSKIAGNEKMKDALTSTTL